MVTIDLLFVAQAGTREAPERPEAPEAPEAQVRPSQAELREQIRQSFQAAQDAANQHRVTVGPNGIIVSPSRTGEPTVYVGGGELANVIPPQAVDIAIAFFVMCAVMVVGWPIARAFGRRLERRGQVASLDAATVTQLQRIEQAVEAMSIEVERISESQRYMARLQSESTASR